MLRFAFIALCALALSVPLAAQTSDAPATDVPASDVGQERRVVLHDGVILTGTIVEQSDEALVLRSSDGLTTTVPLARIARIEQPLERGFTRYDPVPSRLFIAPTGRTMGRGHGRVSGYYIFPSVAYSPTDRIDLSLGSTIPTGGITILNLNVKGQIIRNETVTVAIGGNAFVPFGSDVEGSGTAGTIYGVVTTGSPTSAFTVGLFGVYASDFDDVEFGEGALFLAAYERQVSNSVKLISENYIAIGSGATGGASLAGVRFFGDRLAADLALGFGWGGGDFEVSPIPYLGFSYTFGQ